MNLILIASLCVLATKWVTNAEVSRPATSAPATRWLMPALVLGNPFMQHQLWLGQMTIWACVFLTWAWYFAVRKREIVAGALLALATMKPNLAPLPLLWLVLERRWKTLVSASVFGVLLSLPVWADLGPIGATRQWMHALSTYSPAVTSASGPGANELGHPHVIGLPSALVSVGIPMPGQGVLLGVATVFTIGLWLGRRRIVADDVFGLLVALELGFVFAHDAELLYLVPTAAAVWLHVAHRSRARLAAALCTLVLFVPQRFLRGIDSPLLQHWRTAIVLIAIASLIWMSWRETQLIETDERSS
jgi:hypothetical protein